MKKEIEEKVKESIENALYSTGRFLTHECEQLTDIVMIGLRDSLLTPSADVQERAKEYAKVYKREYQEAVEFAYLAGHAGASSGVQWVKASERLPNHHKEVCVKYHGRYYAGKRNHDSVRPAIYIEMPSGSVTTRDCEYLDESSPSSMQDLEKATKYAEKVAYQTSKDNAKLIGDLMSMQEELQQLRDWKESAMKVMNDIDQECGKVLGLKLGHDVSPEILPALKRMQEENERLLKELKYIEGLTEVHITPEFATINKSIKRLLNNKSMSKNNPLNRADAVRYQVEDDLTVLVAVYAQGDKKAVFNQIELIKSRLEALNPYNHSSEALNKQQ